MFHVDRALAMTAYFLEQAGGRMNDIKLAKLQYLAERRSLVNNFTPITADEGVSLNHGPCLSETLSLTNDTHSNPLWDEYIGFELHDRAAAQDNQVVLLKPFPYGEALSAEDLAVLKWVWGAHGHVEKWQIRKWCHDTCHEYEEVGPGGCKPISLESVFEAEGDSPEEAKRKADEIRYHERFASEYGYSAAS